MIEDIYDASPIQSGLYFHMLLDPGSGVYIEQLSFTLRGPLDVPAFRRAWQLVIGRHPMLRTSFHWREVGKALQVVHGDAAAHVPVHDWRDVPPEEVDSKFAGYAAAARAAGFDLAKAPVMRTELLRTGGQEYRFFWTFPHLVMDGWSFGLVFGEVAAAYGEYVRGGTPDLPPARPYRDYVGWLRQPGNTGGTAFWQDYLAGYTPAPPFTAGRPLAARPDGEASHGVILDQRLIEPVPRLREMTRAHGLTLNTVLQGAWAVLLGRYTGSGDVLAGSTATHRPTGLPGAETIVGPMLSTIGVRTRLDPAAPVAGWLRELQESMAAARENGPVDISALRSLLGLPGDAGLFDTDVAFENVPVPQLRMEGLDITGAWYDGRPHYAVTMILVPGGELAPRVVYDRTRVSAAAASRLAGHFATLLGGFASGAGGTLGELAMISPTERATLLASGRATREPGDTEPPCLHEVFAQTAAQRPQAPAVTCDGESLSYAGLQARANRLAHKLIELGAGPGTRVGLCLGRSLDTITAILGVLASGAAYVPVEPGQPHSRMSYILADAKASILVTHAAADGAAPPFGGPVVHLDAAAEDLAARPATAPASGAGPGDIAYVIYTSGSTGHPKGVMVTHANAGWLLTGASERFALSSSDVWSLCHSYAFDVSVFEMWGALWHGGRLVVVPHDVVRSPDDLHALLRREGVTVFSQTPSAFRQFMLAALAGGAEGLPSLRYVVFAGEYLDVQALEPWLRRYGQDTPALVNMYGITEATVHSTFATIGWDDLRPPARSRAGRPLPHVGIYLLGPGGEPVPAGVPGEIYVSGPSVAAGYQGLDQLTAERFTADPFTGTPGTRMYRSGDLARWIDGELEVLGRIDNQLKVRGYRVEPGEIEAVLRQDEAVRDAVVIRRPDGAGGGQLAGYVVVDGEDSAAVITRLRDHARATLPDFMVPAHLIPLASLPLTANGKLDQAALPAPGRDRAGPGEFVAPRTPLEKSVAAVWQDVLGLDEVGAHDDFFASGGDSLLAVRTVFRLRAELSLDVGVRALFDHPTVAGLAAHLPASPPAAPPIPRRERVAYQPEGGRA